MTKWEAVWNGPSSCAQLLRTWEASELMQGVARTLRDVEALRYAMLSLMPEPDWVLAVRLIQRRYRISARRARQILGLR